MDIFFILILSVPVFYIFGIVSFIRWVIRNNEASTPKTDAAFLSRLVRELQTIATISPNTTVKTLLDQYSEKLKNLQPIPSKIQPNIVPGEKDRTIHEKAPSEHVGKDFDFANWYSNNSINLLLYLGAFLIVMSAAIFVGFQWETIPGAVKALMLTLIAVGFFGFGSWFYTLPKIKNAGGTFIAIGALLIPLCGAAWYNFVLKGLGFSGGTVWLTTSCISLGIYILLASKYRNVFYIYIANVSTLSFSLSLVNTFQLASEFYIIASILTSFVLFFIGKEVKKQDAFFTEPFTLCSQALMPISLIYGVYVAINGDKLYSLEAAISVFLGALYYFLLYTIAHTPWKLLVSELLFTFSIVLCAKWLRVNDVHLLLAVVSCGLLYLAYSHLLSTEKHDEESSQLSHVLGMFIIILSFLLGYLLRLPATSIILFSILPIFVGIIEAYFRKNIVYVTLSVIFLAVSSYILHQDIFKMGPIHQLGMIYTLFGVGSYATMVYSKRYQLAVRTFVFSSGLFFALGLICTISTYNYFSLVAFTIALVFFLASKEFSEAKLIYASNAFIYLSVFSLLTFRHVPGERFILYFTAFPYLFYAIGAAFTNVDKPKASAYRLSGLVTNAFVPITAILSFSDNSYSLGTNTYELNELISFYTATVLMSIDSYLNKKQKLYYLASAFALITFLWQLNYIHVRETLAYILPIGMYFLCLAYTRRRQKDYDTMQLLDFVGLVFLLGIPFIYSYSDERVKYSITLGVMGLILLILGNSLSYKLYRFAGFAGVVLAVLPQTYEYILLLPRWLLVGLVGLALLTTAITLLLKRKDH